jgi:hypothetical protein
MARKRSLTSTQEQEITGFARARARARELAAQGDAA